jgi:SNF2 family DNA or RNA helicase
VLKEEDVLPRDKATHNTIYCELPATARKEYERLEKEFFVELEAGGQVEVFNAASLAMKLRQYIQGFLYDPLNSKVLPANTVKAEALKELVESLDGRPLLCAIQFQHEVDMLRKVFGYRIPALYSKTSSVEQARVIEEWNRGEHPLLLSHPASGGIGLNLQDGGSTMCWYAHTWDLEHYLQFNARIDRQGQKHAVVNHHLVMKDTVEEVIVEALEWKESDQSSFVNALRKYRR